jgi:transposase
MFKEITQVYLHREPVDFRKSINGLSVIVEEAMSLSPLNGALFVFCNRSRNKLKILYWDSTGFCLWYKRLEKERFRWPKKWSMNVIELSEQQLNWLLQGFDITAMQGHKKLDFSAII